MTTDFGKDVYQRECVICHGESGNSGDAESANLQTSLLNIDQIIDIIKTGTSDMPPFDYLKEEEVKAVSIYAEKFQDY